MPLSRNLKAISITFLFVLICPNFVAAKFGSNGKVTTPIGNDNDKAESLILQPDGKLVAAGWSYNGSNGDFALARYESNGSLDLSFGTGGKVTTPFGSDQSCARSLILQPDGKLVAAGYSDDDFALARYNSDGSLDLSFGTGGKVTTHFSIYADGTESLILQPDGKLVAAGHSNRDFALARYNSDGSLDLSFGTGGKVITSFGSDQSRARSLILQPDGKLVAAGSSGNISNYDFALARYNSNGSLDLSFGTDGTVTTPIGSYDHAYSLILQPDGKLVAAGQSNNGGYDFALARYENDGDLDSSFGTGGKVTTPIGSSNDNARSLILQPDGKLVAAGYSNNGGYDFALARYNSNGSLDLSFGTGGKVITPIGSSTDYAHSLILQPDGKLVAAGSSDNGSNDDFALARYNSNGSLDIQDDPPLMTEIKPDHALAGQTITLDIRGWNLDDVIGVQLRNAGASVNGSGLTISSGSRLTVQFALPASPGLYDLYLAKNSVNKTFTGAFNMLAPLFQPIQWQHSDLGKAGDPIAGPAGIAIGEADSSGQQAIFVANSDTRLYAYKKNTSWSITPLPLEIGCFQDVVLLDADLDGVYEVYGANSYPWVFQYQWAGSNWAGNSFSAYSGPLAPGSQAGGGLTELYTMSGNYLAQSSMFNQTWVNRLVSPGGGTMLCSVAGDADNDLSNEVYAANADHKLYQSRYLGTSWRLTTTVYAGSNNMTSLAIGDLDQDGANELYGSNLDGNIYQFKWNGAAWFGQPVNTTSLEANKIAISDADNDGYEELYAAGQDGHLYQLKPSGANWQVLDLGNAGSALIALAIGDGDNSHQYKAYAVGADAHVYQFWAVGSTPTPGATSLPDSEKRLRVIHSQINPLHGEQALIRWYQFKDNPVKITIYNLLGDKIAGLLLAGFYPAGEFYEVSWNGKNDSGAVAGSGIYLVYLESGDYKARAKIAVIK